MVAFPICFPVFRYGAVDVLLNADAVIVILVCRDVPVRAVGVGEGSKSYTLKRLSRVPSNAFFVGAKSRNCFSFQLFKELL